MQTVHFNHFQVTPERSGADRFTKASYPVRYGRYGEIKTTEYLFEFNLNGEIKTIRGINGNWPHPSEWLKRTMANDWVYYSVGRYHRLFSFLGEYYLPCLSYPGNSPWDYDPFGNPDVQKAMAAGVRLQAAMRRVRANGAPAGIKDFLSRIASCDTNRLRAKSRELHRILGGPVSVLPPDARHVDYDVIPLMVTDGCLYDCDFCCVKSHRRFKRRSREDIEHQIQRLRRLYGADMLNYNALFLGNHDALAAGRQSICHAAESAYHAFEFEHSHLKNPTLFLFGSVDSLLKAGNKVFEALDRLPYYIYINIGLESADPDTLVRINKPLERGQIVAAFQKMLDINRHFLNLEVTANFLLGEDLPLGHHEQILELVRHHQKRFYSKGAIYLSPLDTSRNRRQLLNQFIEIKTKSRLPVFLYLIQRL